MPTFNQSSQSSVAKIIIIGGGIGGLTLARACLDVGIEVELYEKRSLNAMLSGAGGIFIQRNAMRVYKLLYSGKIYESFYALGGKIFKGGFLNKNGSELYINTPEFIGEADLGICLARGELQQILLDALPPGIVRTGMNFERFEETEDHVKVYFADGSTTTGDILVGADGLYSQVRASLAKKQRLEPPIYSGMCCWRGFFNAASVPLDKKYSWSEYWGKGNRFGYFHVGGGKYCFYGFNNSEPGGNDESVGGALKALELIFSDYAEPIPSIIKALENESIYRDDIFDRPPLGGSWGKGRVTLIGDAAHPVQPNLGQGGCMAIEDGFELVKLLHNQASSADVVSVLRQFEASRSQRVTRVFTTSRQVGWLGQTSNTIGCFLRNWIYKLTPTWLADLQFRWLFDYQPSWKD